MPAPVIAADAIAKSYGPHRILDNLSLRIGEGERYGLVGLNGAGKTTLIRLLLGVLRPESGTIVTLGCDPWSHEAQLFRRMGVVLEHDGFWGNLNFVQNMNIFGRAKGVSSHETAAYIERYWSDSSLCNNTKAVKYLSRGQRMQCAIARAFLGNPRLFLFDEPAVALDVGAYEHFKRLVLEFSSSGAAFLISSHQLDAIDDLCTRVGILRERHVTELEDERHANGARCWELETDGRPQWGTVIADLCGGTPVWKNGEWKFSAGNRDVIPRLIKRLVDEGCEIRKIAPVAGGFSDAIREEYRGGADATMQEADA